MAINSSINATWVINSASLNAPAGAGVTPGPPRPEGSSSQINIPVARNPSVISLWFLKDTLFQFGGALILELLNHTRTFKAKDPRDRIFALVGLASHFDPGFTKRLVDYNKSFRDVQIELAMWLMGNQRRTESMVLSYAGDTGQQLDSLPSWVPDWSGGTASSYACPLAATYYAYHDIATKPNPRVDRRFISGTKMEIWCTVLDLVVSTVNHVPYMTSTALLTDEQLLSQHFREMEAWDDACWDIVVNSGPSHIYAATGQHIFEAYWRTLVFDTNPENRGTIAPPELKSSYEHWASSYGTMNELERLTTERPPGYGLAQAMGLSSVASVQAMRGRAFDDAFRTYAAGRKFCATGRGYIGWVPVAAREGDLVCYFEENTLPFVIRGCEEGGYRVVGDCYLHGMMHGPGLDAVPRSRKIVLH